MSDREATPVDCARARQAIHARLDGEPVEESRAVEHLSRCASCRQVEAELRRIQLGLRALPQPELRDGALAEVWARTSRAEPPASRVRRGRLDWRLAAAAVLALALVALWQLTGPGSTSELAGGEEPEVSQAELDRAVAETRLVLGLTSRALRRAEEVAVERVLGHEVSGALRRIPIQWPDKHTAERRRSES